MKFKHPPGVTWGALGLVGLALVYYWSEKIGTTDFLLAAILAVLVGEFARRPA